MEKIVTVICNVILFLLLVFNVNDYPDMVLGISLVVLICLIIFYLIRYRKKYIDKSTIIIYVTCLLLQILLIIILGKLGIWNVSSGFMGLGGGEFGIIFYFILHIGFVSLMLLINLLKYIIKKLKIEI